MALPDASGLERITSDEWRALDARLRAIGVGREYMAKLAAVGSDLLEPMREALHVWKTRAGNTPADDAYRLLMLGDGVPDSAARIALGDDLVQALLRGGALVAHGDSLRSPYRMQLLGPSFVVGDMLSQAGDAVMAAGGTTAVLAHVALSTPRCDRVLDMGCGAGALAILAAPRVGEVVGVDINPRALTLARASAAMAGVRNVEWRAGDLFAPVAGETFDLILAQPPFVARHPSARDATYLWGGERGDELALRLLAEAPRHLASGGRAVVLANFPIVDDEPIEARVRRAIGDAPVSALVIETPEAGIDELAARDALVFHPAFDAAYVEDVVATRAHLARAGIRAVRQSIVVLERGAHVWTATFATRPLGRARIAMPRIASLLAANDLLAGDEKALDAARLRLASGLSFEPKTPPASGASTVILPDDMPGIVAAIPAPVHALLAAVHASPNVAAAMSEMSANMANRAAVIGKQREAIRAALRHGLLEVH